MSLHLKFDSPKGSRPTAGQIYLMKTTAGYIPVGVTSTKALTGACVMLHPYRALVQDITDTSYYPLVEKNELLIPPVMLPKSDFRKGGWFTKNPNKNAPAPIPFDKYYYYSGANAWNPHELGFAPAYAGRFPLDRLPDFVPIEQRKINIILHDSGRPEIETVDQAPPGTYFMFTFGIVGTRQLEFAIEDALAYYGLIRTPRPPHADNTGLESTSAQGESTKPQTPEQFLQLVEIEDLTMLKASMAHTPEEIEDIVSTAGYLPNGYFFEALATYLVGQHGLDAGKIDPDSESGMFCFYGDRATLDALRTLMLEVVNNPTTLATTIQQAEAAGHDLHN